VLHGVPVASRPGGGTVDRAGDARHRGGAMEMLAAPARPVESIVAAERELTEVALEEVTGAGVGDGAVIGLHPRELGDLARGAHVDRGQAGFEDSRGDPLVFDTCDDAVAAPSAEPAWRVVAA